MQEAYNLPEEDDFDEDAAYRCYNSKDIVGVELRLRPAT